MKRKPRGRTLWAAGLLAAAALALAGCSNLGYYWQSVNGHLAVLNAAQPVRELLQQESLPPRLREQLLLSQRIRDFASRELKLPDNASYRRYADLQRSAAIWNVVAAPLLSLELKTWCFPVTGCVRYRGYYDEAEARAEARALAEQGFESNAYPVPAYSTLGYLNWLGGDPLLNTFIHYPEGELARLVFHELAHQVLYVKDDSTFNESFATAVERLGGAVWLQRHASAQARSDYAAYEERRRQFRALSRATRARLEAIYDNPDTSDERKAADKERALLEFRAGYARLRAGWGEVDPRLLRAYDRWVANANNAWFGAQATYDELVPGFEALFRREDGDWQRFYDAARELARKPRQQRHALLKALAGG